MQKYTFSSNDTLSTTLLPHCSQRGGGLAHAGDTIGLAGY